MSDNKNTAPSLLVRFEYRSLCWLLKIMQKRQEAAHRKYCRWGERGSFILRPITIIGARYMKDLVNDKR